MDLLKRYTHVEDADEPRTVRAKVTGQVLTLDETLQETIPALLWLLDVLPDDSPFRTLEPPQRRQRTLEALKRVLLRESQVQPLLLVFEDLHWIDTETQALLDSLIESLPTARLLLLVNYRPEYQHGWGSKTYYTQLRLDPLPPASAEAVLDALLGQDPSLAPLKRLLIERTEGNPFFLEESVRTLVETGVLVGEPGAYRLAQSLPTIQVPATVQAVLAARIDRLPPEDEAAAPDRRGHRHRGAPAAAAGHCRAARGGPASRPGAPPGGRVPLRDAPLPGARLHLQACPDPGGGLSVVADEHAATATISRLPRCWRRVSRDGSRRSPNCWRITTPRRACSAQAVPYWQRAGQRAVERSAYVEAISHLTKGLEVLKTLPDTPERTQQELDLQIALGPALMATKGYAAPEVDSAYARARELCQQVGETPQLFPVLLGTGAFYMAAGEFQTARELRRAAPQPGPDASKTRRSSCRPTRRWERPCSGLESWPRPARTWSRALRLYDPQQPLPLSVSRMGMTPG